MKGLPLVEVDLSSLQDHVRESSTNALDAPDGVHDLSLSFNGRVLNSQNVRKLVCFLKNQG